MLYWYFRLSMLLNMAVFIPNFLWFMSKQVSNTHTHKILDIYICKLTTTVKCYLTQQNLFMQLKNKTFWCIFVQLQCWHALQESKLGLHVAYCINTTEGHVYAKNDTQFNHVTITGFTIFKTHLHIICNEPYF